MYSKLKISILLYLQRSRTNKQGKCPVRCRITYLGKRREFASGILINPSSWHSNKQKVHPLNLENEIINSSLSLIRQKINQAFLFLKLVGKEFDVDDIFDKYKGNKPKNQKTIMNVINYHNNRMQKLIGIDSTYTSWEKYLQTQKHIEGFLYHQYGKKDYPLTKLNEVFLHDFDYYLRTERRFKQSTIYKSIQRFRKMLKLALAMNYLKKDPFLLYKAKRYKKEIIYLTNDELSKLRQYSFAQKRLEQVRDMFVFCCYTGLAYREMANLKQSNIVRYIGNNLWIQMKRQKTGKQISVPVLPIALEILQEYMSEEGLLPVISNQKFNSYLKEIAELVGLEKNLTSHIARKTFATTILLFNDVPMEIVSELLGHSDISVTAKSYGKVLQNKVNDHMSILIRKLSV